MHRRLDLIAAGRPDMRADAQLEHAARVLDGAWRRLKSLDKGDTGGVATAEPVCRICGIRPRAEKKAGRCETCASWFQRNGHERPTRLDQDAVGQARQAQARRRARGEGWGDEAYSNVATLTPAEWATYEHSKDPDDWPGPAVTGPGDDVHASRADRAERRRRNRLRALSQLTDAGPEA